MKCVIAIQARNNSTRLPNKINLPFGDSTVLQTIVEKCKKVDPFPKVLEMMVKVISSHEDPVDHPDVYISQTGIDDLVGRYMDAMNHFEADMIIRVTADCPLINTVVIADTVQNLMKFDYVSNTNPRTFPDGFDVQAASRKAMEWVDKNQTNREHPFWDLDFNLATIESFEKEGMTINRTLNGEQVILNPFHPLNKLSIDTEEDLARCRKAISRKNN